MLTIFSFDFLPSHLVWQSYWRASVNVLRKLAQANEILPKQLLKTALIRFLMITLFVIILVEYKLHVTKFSTEKLYSLHYNVK